ncbi:hypothetical protein GN244_ATG02161 [Phytophthora infestans]|uniref:Uncharacterized protein n=1 Tax=Phytophthora infestans TaxID=4787 RepID=A0A833T323_PHYIN|nr:hypothetical protein GN244_ATG02161 [Phytophthora infestans]
MLEQQMTTIMLSGPERESMPIRFGEGTGLQMMQHDAMSGLRAEQMCSRCAAAAKINALCPIRTSMWQRLALRFINRILVDAAQCQSFSGLIGDGRLKKDQKLSLHQRKIHQAGISVLPARR